MMLMCIIFYSLFFYLILVVWTNATSIRRKFKIVSEFIIKIGENLIDLIEAYLPVLIIIYIFALINHFILSGMLINPTFFTLCLFALYGFSHLITKMSVQINIKLKKGIRFFKNKNVSKNFQYNPFQDKTLKSGFNHHPRRFMYYMIIYIQISVFFTLFCFFFKSQTNFVIWLIILSILLILTIVYIMYIRQIFLEFIKIWKAKEKYNFYKKYPEMFSRNYYINLVLLHLFWLLIYLLITISFLFFFCIIHCQTNCQIFLFYTLFYIDDNYEDISIIIAMICLFLVKPIKKKGTSKFMDIIQTIFFSFIKLIVLIFLLLLLLNILIVVLIYIT